MNRRQIAIALSVMLAVLAGDFLVAGQEYKCTATTQECLDIMVSDYRNKGWLGLEYEWEEATHSMRITRVLPDSPAQKAGFQIEDRVTAMDGLSFIAENEEKLAECQKKKAPGVRFVFTVLRSGKSKDLPATLGSVPEDIVATAVGRHMLEHVSPQPDKTAKKEGS